MSILSRIKNLFAASDPRGQVDTIESATVRGTYDAARTDGTNQQHWIHADALDADAANSKTVRQRISQRSRYEIGSSGQGKGVQLTQANYVVGRGPKLRMQTQSKGFNRMVEAAWNAWSAEVKLARKLRTAIKAKVCDGESFMIAAQNPRLRSPVKLDLRAVECEQVTTPQPRFDELNQVDGIKFDEFGNPLYYDVLDQHPGGLFSSLAGKSQRIDAKWVMHLFREDRPGQHRGVGELHPSLNLFANGRRYREAVLQAAENIANFSILLKTQQMPNTGPDPVRPFTTLPIEKSMFVSLPYGFDVYQPDARQPGATYPEFTRGISSESARPLNMPYNISAADSSGYSFSGGKLDHLTYFVSVDVEQAEIEELVLEPLFPIWFEEAVKRYGWGVDGTVAPAHAWDWPAKPVIDEQKTANARKIDLSTGNTHHRRQLAEGGWDADEEDATAAADLEMTTTEYRRRLFDAALATKVEQSATDDDGEQTPGDRGQGTGTNGRTNGRVPAASSNGNGNGRLNR